MFGNKFLSCEAEIAYRSLLLNILHVYMDVFIVKDPQRMGIIVGVFSNYNDARNFQKKFWRDKKFGKMELTRTQIVRYKVDTTKDDPDFEALVHDGKGLHYKNKL